MITANNLKKVEFVPGEKIPLDEGAWYRDWCLPARPNSEDEVLITVTETNGKFSPAHVELSVNGEYVSLNTTSVIDLLALKNLLK